MIVTGRQGIGTPSALREGKTGNQYVRSFCSDNPESDPDAHREWGYDPPALMGFFHLPSIPRLFFISDCFIAHDFLHNLRSSSRYSRSFSLRKNVLVIRSCRSMSEQTRSRIARYGSGESGYVEMISVKVNPNIPEPRHPLSTNIHHTPANIVSCE